MINTDKKANTPINRTELEEIVINNLQKNCSDSICQALEDVDYNLNSEEFSFFIKNDRLDLIIEPRNKYDETDEKYDEYHEEYYNIYKFSFRSVAYDVTMDNVKYFVNDILADYVESLPLLGLINLCTYTYACPVNVMQSFVFNLFLTKSIFAWGKYIPEYAEYDNIITYILIEYPQDFVRFALINIKHYSSIWKKNPKIIPNLIEMLIKFPSDKPSPEFQTLWAELLKQNSDYSHDGKAVITRGLLKYTNILCVVDFSLFYDFAEAYNDKKIAQAYAITFKVNSVNSLTQFVNDLLAHQGPSDLKDIASTTKKLVANGVQFEIDNRFSKKLDALIKETDVADISPLILINQILKIIANK